ncbi:MAG: group III truncated hemoglobin [Myxococcota bacterium]
MSSYFIPTPKNREAFDADSISRLVRRFYARVQEDELLAPVFERRVESWDPHLERMIAFWTTVLRGEPAYRPGPKGPPPQVHRGIGELAIVHFTRWLALFETVAHEVFPPDAARFVVARAERMGRALSAHLEVA